MIIPQFDPISGRSRAIVSTPRPGHTFWSSGTTGSDDRKFSDTLTNVPGADKNRFLFTLEAALPLDVEITLGSYISLNDRCALDRFFRPRVPVFLFAANRSVHRYIVTVPEPSSAGLVIVLVVGGSLFRLQGEGRYDAPCRVGNAKIDS